MNDRRLEMAQKTGFYFDLRALRARLEALAEGLLVLDCYSYVGTAVLRMARGGALEVLAVDRNARAVASLPYARVRTHSEWIS